MSGTRRSVTDRRARITNLGDCRTRRAVTLGSDLRADNAHGTGGTEWALADSPARRARDLPPPTRPARDLRRPQRDLRRSAAWTVLLALALLATAVPVASADDTTGAAGLEIIAVDADADAGASARVVLAAPPRLATRTLTAADLDVRVDGRPRRATLQRLPASDIEVAVVVDTAAGPADLHALQAAVAELALDLPQGARLRIVDGQASASSPVAVPGPAIAAVRDLQPTTGDDLDAAVRRALELADASPQSRTALLVIGRDLAARLDAVDDRPVESLSYLIDIGAGGDPVDLLGPRAAGTAVGVADAAAARSAVGEVSDTLRSLYLAEITLPEAGARNITLALSAADGPTAAATVALDPDTLRPAPAAPAGDDARPRPAPRRSSGAAALLRWAPWLQAASLVLAVAAALFLWRLLRGARTVPATTAPLRPVQPGQQPSPVRPRRRKPREKPARPQRPIAKLSPEVGAALARAHLGLRQLALASRETADTVPDDLFRFVEARASAALAGHDHPLGVVLLARLGHDDGDTHGSADIAMVERAAEALATGWQHTAQRHSAPPAVLEINALLRAGGPDSNGVLPPVTPVRALNPLVEIGLEHMVLAAQPDEHAGLIARAVTVVDIMRAARLARPVLTLSPYLLSDAERYHAACSADPTDAAARDDWLQFLCEAIARRCTVAVEQLARLQRLRERYRAAAPDARAARLIDVLLAHPVLDRDLVARHLGDEPAARAEALAAGAVRAGWLAPHPGDAHAWIAPAVLEVFAVTAGHTAGTAAEEAPQGT